ncbi:MAG: HD domain-containing protein [Clostridia bacterium]|nr:HD domain-containing protein [Clostridia bacterium]
MNLSKVALAMTRYFEGDVRRINHFMKVHAFAKVIGESEKLDNRTLEILEVTAYVHDIGIKNSELKYNSSSGYYQQIEGPAEAEKLLTPLGYDLDFIERVKYLISRHHKYTDIDGADCRILIEADFIVNAYEDKMSTDAIKNVYGTIFETETGKKILHDLYLMTAEQL